MCHSMSDRTTLQECPSLQFFKTQIVSCRSGFGFNKDTTAKLRRKTVILSNILFNFELSYDHFSSLFKQMKTMSVFIREGSSSNDPSCSVIKISLIYQHNENPTEFTYRNTYPFRYWSTVWPADYREKLHGLHLSSECLSGENNATLFLISN